MRIAEIYDSIQGEGRLTGTPSTFIRTSGCNLRCWFCDTPYTSWKPEGQDLSVEMILQQALSRTGSHVVLTGGEPMLHAELIPLCEELRRANRHLTIETAGTLFLPVACDLMSISPKLSNSTPSADAAGAWQARHEQDRYRPDVLHRLIGAYDYQLKFVIDTPADVAEVEDLLRELPQADRDHVWLMPQGTELERLHATGEWLEPFCREQGYHFCPRRHVEWFGFTRGT